MAFPAVKIGALLMKQISKPLANAVKSRAKRSPFFRTYICMPPAQFYHWCDVKLKMWAMNLGKPVKVAPLNENMAIELGAELLGEAIIFGVAAAILSYEYVRSSRKESQIEAERKQEFERIQNELKELYYAQAKQESQIRELVRVLKVNIPSFNYKDPLIYNTDNVPEHYKLEVQEEEGPTIYATMNNWLWSAVEYIIPSAKDSGKGDIQDRPIVLVVRDEKPQLANKMTPASSTTVPVSSTPSEKGKV